MKKTNARKCITAGASLIMAVITRVPAADLKLDQERSRIHVDAKATGHDFTGTLKDYHAKVTGNETTNAPKSFELEWDFNDLKTGDAKRDKEMISWLGGGKPKGSFEFTKSWTDKAGVSHAQGELTINKVTKTINFPYEVKREGDWVTIDGEAKMDYKDFKLPLIRAMLMMTVDPKLVIRFHVVGEIE